MTYTALEISDILRGNIVGDSSVTINSIAKIEDGKKGDLTFLANAKYNSFLYKSQASVIIVDKNIKLKKEVNPTLIYVDDAYSAFSQLLNLYNKVKVIKKGIDQNTHIETGVNISKSSYIGPFTFIGKNVKIGKHVQILPHCYIGENTHIQDDSILFSKVTIYPNSKIGKNNIIHSGAVIGSDGFGFAKNKKDKFKKIAQVGNVKLEDNVEIGANTTIDRATLGTTYIGHGVKLDNLVQIGHNVKIGANTVIAGQTGVAGSTQIGENCMIGGAVGIAGHLKIGKNVKIAGHTGVGSDIKDNNTVQGPYAFDQKSFLRSYIIFKKLPEIYATLEKIKKDFHS